MVNFNGQLQKRKVNLGGGFKKNRNDLIQQTQKQREKREKDRELEVSVILIQKRIRRYIELLHVRKAESDQWYSNVQQVSDINNLIFQFNHFYGLLFKKNELRLVQLEKLLDILNEAHALSQVRDINTKHLYRTIATCLQLLVQETPVDTQCLGCLLNIAELLKHRVRDIGSLGVIPSLTLIVKNLYNQSEPLLLDRLLTVINLYSDIEINSYIKFLASSYIKDLPNFKINFKVLATGADYSNLATDEKIMLLTNMIGNLESYTVDFVSSIAWIVPSIKVSLITEEDKPSSGIDEGDETSYDFACWKIITDETFEIIKTLYKREFIRFASQAKIDWHLISRLYGCLINLLPSAKSSLIIYLIPNMFAPSLNSIVEADIFHEILEVSEDSLFSVSTSFLKRIFVDKADFIFYDLEIFLELLNYRIIISNDLDLFTGYGFDLEKFRSIAIFLKKLVFNSIWNHQKIKELVSGPVLSRFNRILRNVLTQIYLKDSRQQVLEKDIWLINFNRVGKMVNFVIDYELKKELAEEDDELLEVEDSYISSLKPDVQAKIQIYLKTPFFIPFDKRVEIFQTLVSRDRAPRNPYEGFFATPEVIVRREHILEDAFTHFNKLGRLYKNKVGIKFTNEDGEEAGVDGGGVTKEFLTSLVKEGFRDLFVENSKNELYPNPQIGLCYQYRIDTEEQMKKLEYIKFLGKTIGKCLNERVLVDARFATFFLTKINSGYKNSFDDLKSLDSELYSNLAKLLNYSDEEVEALNLTFSVDERIGSKTMCIDLIPSGSRIPVTGATKMKFVHELSNYKLNGMLNLQSNYFLSGLFEMIPRDWLSMFNPFELQMLISGENKIDVEDLKKNTNYNGDYSEKDSLTIKYFWEVVEEMSTVLKSQLIKFVTAVPRGPLLGFGALKPKFGITLVGNSDGLPTAATCFNLLKLPDYQDKEVLRHKLLYAITSEARFELA